MGKKPRNKTLFFPYCSYTGKEKSKTRIGALSRIRKVARFAQEPESNFAVYRCSKCHEWHVGHKFNINKENKNGNGRLELSQ